MSYTCPNPNRPPYTLWQVVDLLEKSNDFAQFFATQLKNALLGDKKAAACVESYLKPTDTELAAFGITTKSDIAGMCRCTDVGKLVLVKAQEMAPQVFQ
jgi:hypothetical protein